MTCRNAAGCVPTRLPRPQCGLNANPTASHVRDTRHFAFNHDLPKDFANCLYRYNELIHLSHEIRACVLQDQPCFVVRRRTTAPALDHISYAKKYKSLPHLPNLLVNEKQGQGDPLAGVGADITLLVCSEIALRLRRHAMTLGGCLRVLCTPSLRDK